AVRSRLAPPNPLHPTFISLSFAGFAVLTPPLKVALTNSRTTSGMYCWETPRDGPGSDRLPAFGRPAAIPRYPPDRRNAPSAALLGVRAGARRDTAPARFRSTAISRTSAAAATA